MISHSQKDRIKQVLATFDTVNDANVSLREGPDCVVSFTTTFGTNSAYDLELTEGEGGYDAVLLTSAETPVMSDGVDQLTDDAFNALFDHVLETIRELEGN